MGVDVFNLVLVTVALFVYGSSCIISLVFAFSLETYEKIDERLNLAIIPARIVSPLEKNIGWFDHWLTSHNKPAGLVLTVLSIFSLNTAFTAIGLIQKI